jgi:K+-transporting ATPase ATPase A chain
MTANGWLQILLFFGLLLAITKPLGVYMARVLEREKTFADRLFNPMERLLYRITGIDESHEMGWKEYSIAMLLFSAVTMLLTYALQRLQTHLPWNPQHLGAVAPDLAFNTAASFTTNTNWQSYTPESTMSYLTQMAGLATHNFWSAATGMALAVALIRGIARKESNTLGNFWVDLPTLLFGETASATSDHNDRNRWEAKHPDDHNADDRSRPRGLSGSDQGAGYEWRRLLQCEQRPSV